LLIITKGRRGEARGDDDYGRENNGNDSLWTIFALYFYVIYFLIYSKKPNINNKSKKVSRIPRLFSCPEALRGENP